LIINDLGRKCGGKDFFVGKESLFNFAANKKTANAGNIRSLIFFEKRKV
jgi:Ran GTPase-activating protein (RanGAP) involved in mRNA processing and transport